MSSIWNKSNIQWISCYKFPSGQNLAPTYLRKKTHTPYIADIHQAHFQTGAMRTTPDAENKPLIKMKLSYIAEPRRKVKPLMQILKARPKYF